GSGQAVGLTTGNATFRLRGLWSEVFTNGTTPSMTVSLTNGANAVDFGNNANSRESSAFYHVNIVHDYMKSFFPSFTSMDNALTTNVDVAGTCNAFYNGSSINFYQSGAGCNSFALIGDVVYHEYGHGINDKYYQSQGAFWLNGAMGEGYADIWALGITESPILGLGNSQSLPNDVIRRYDIDPKIYPQDLIGEVHADGEIIAGAWWDLGQNFGDIQQMVDLFSDTYDAVITGLDGNEGEVFVDILVEALQVDDAPGNGGDNDITNGTPNDLDIINAFDAHGITLLSNATLEHSAIQAHDDQDIEVDVTVVNDYPWAMNDAIVVYRLNSSMSWNTVSLANIGGNVYSASIPGQPNGTVVAYYVALENLNNTLANVQPVAANLAEPNVPHYILVGYDQNRIEDFDNFQDNGWVEGLPTDNNSTGTWTIDVPIGSFSDDGVMVQTDEDHTPGTGNIACAFTGNASNASAGIGENDVDGGHTTLMTPVFDLSEFTNPAISFWRYYTNSPPSGANPGADWWQVLVTDDGTDWVFVENTKVSDPSWRRVAFRVTDYVDVTDNIQIKFIASDSTHLGQNLDGGSLIEGALDDLEIWEVAGGSQSGIGETEISVFNMYPNPTNGNVNINLTLASNTKIRVDVLNMLGAKVLARDLGSLQMGNHNIRLDLDALRPGVYNVGVKSDLGV
ncbi:MAG: T9SS type A sorting domain-containing protein, partial [Flavobacteriales bacterium]|nr:T9SS type A sorting domain-containing protein [Flavobacteriales bacterium]